jgi:hypothetical protein
VTRAHDFKPGQRFGKLSVVGLHPERDARNRNRLWICRCECGGETLAAGSDLVRGHSTSCGCERNRGRHGMAKHGKVHPLYRAWSDLNSRCSNPNHQSWEYYGGRGITVCQRWRDSFEAFASDMGARPTPRHSIDRIDNDRGYEPGNCRWATASEQMRNRRKPSQMAATAVTCKRVSAPMRALYAAGLLTGRRLAYGCGRGVDARLLGFDSRYDPHFHPDLDRAQRFDVITCVYVLNVLGEDARKQVIAEVRALLAPGGHAYFAVRRDVQRNGAKGRGVMQSWVLLPPPFKVVCESRGFCIYQVGP